MRVIQCRYRVSSFILLRDEHKFLQIQENFQTYELIALRLRAQFLANELRAFR